MHFNYMHPNCVIQQNWIENNKQYSLKSGAPQKFLLQLDNREEFTFVVAMINHPIHLTILGPEWHTTVALDTRLDPPEKSISIVPGGGIYEITVSPAQPEKEGFFFSQTTQK